MLRGYWCIGFAAWALAANVNAQPIEDGSHNQDSARDVQANARQNEPPASEVAVPSVAISSNQPSQIDRERADADLEAQKEMAFWAMVMSILSALTVLVTGIGVWFVKRTLDATLQAVEDTSEATDEMRESNAIARDSAERQLRAYVGAFDLVVEDFRPGVKPIFRFKPTNTGQTPAYDLQIVSAVNFSSDLERGQFSFGGQKPESKIVLQPSQPANQTHLGPRGITQQEMAMMQSGAMFVILGGYISYRSAFGRLHRTTFKAFIEPNHLDRKGNGMLTNCSHHNNAN